MPTSFLIRILISAIIIATVTEIAGKMPKIGALILSLPVVTIIAIVMIWIKEGEIEPIVQMSREMFILVPIGLILFVPLAFAANWNLGFWSALFIGIGCTSLALASWSYWSFPS